MDERAAEALNTSLTAGHILSIGAGRLSASLDKFSGWLLAGFGATYGLLLAHLDSVAVYLRVSNIKFGAAFFLAAACAAACQKLIAAYVAAGTAAEGDGRDTGKDLANAGVPLNVESMYKQVNQGLLWPWRTFNARMTAKAVAGDYAVMGRFHAKASQVQCYFVVAQFCLSLVSAILLVCGISI